MGRLAVVKAVEANIEGGEDIPICKVDLGGGDIRRVPLLLPPNTDARPRPGDYAALISNPGSNHYTAIAFGDQDNTSESGNGEWRAYSRDGGGAVVAEIFLKTDGSIRIENGGGFIELGASGQVNINGNFTVDP